MALNDDIRSAQLLVVGAGFFGATIAERAANELNINVVVIDRRKHIAGNAFSYFDNSTGIEVHKYGTHIFHTDNEEVWKYVNRFTPFNNYEHHVFTISKSEVFSLPFNLFTLSQISKRFIEPDKAAEIIKSRSKPSRHRNLEERAIEMVGQEMYDRLIKGYTAKQWQTDPRDLPPEIITRLPVRLTFDSRYFDDRYQGIPLCGYTELVKRMLSSSRIKVHLGIDFQSIRNEIKIPVVYSGPIDEYFAYSDGRLNWRTLDFEFEIHEKNNYQGNAVINYADIEIPYTRIHEFRFLHPERTYSDSKTVIAKEYSRKCEEQDEPYYPINSNGDSIILKRYRNRMPRERNVIFGGRLGTYKYLDMHMAIASALNIASSKLKGLINR